MNIIGYINPNSMMLGCSVSSTADSMTTLGCRTIIYEDGENNHGKWIKILHGIGTGDTLVLNSIMDAFVSTFALKVFLERCVTRGVRIILLKENIDSQEEHFSKYMNTLTNIFSILRYTYRSNPKAESRHKTSLQKMTPKTRQKFLRDEKILNMYISEYSTNDIMEECHITRGTLYNVLKKHGIETYRNKISRKKK